MTLILEDKSHFTPEVFGISSPTSTKISLHSPQSDISKACQLWEEATEMLVQAGKIFAEIQESTKRGFTKLLSETGLEKSQVNKLIKASVIASEIPTVAPKLGMNVLNQLAQPKNKPVLEAIKASDTQILVAQKIKHNRSLATPVVREDVKLSGKKGKERLRIDIPGCAEARDIYEEFKATGLSALEWLQNLRKQPTIKEVLEAKNSILELPEPWKVFPQQWQHEGKNCSYDLIDGERVIRWGDFETKIADELASKYINPRTFLDFELLKPGATVKIQAISGDRSWNTFQGSIRETTSNKAKVCLQGDDKEKFFSLNDLKIVKPSPDSWKRVSSQY